MQRTLCVHHLYFHEKIKDESTATKLWLWSSDLTGKSAFKELIQTTKSNITAEFS